jgi:hypothetical protein
MLKRLYKYLKNADIQKPFFNQNVGIKLEVLNIVSQYALLE